MKKIKDIKKRPYRKPKVSTGPAFERVALSCDKAGGGCDEEDLNS
jgi:hypothetical protein